MKLKFLFLGLILLVLFIGCIQTLSEQELEEKAKEYFYSLGEVEIVFEGFNSADFVLDNVKVVKSAEYDFTEYDCELIAKGECVISPEEFSKLNETIYVYEFKLTSEASQFDRLVWGIVILKQNGEPIAYYISGFELFPS